MFADDTVIIVCVREEEELRWNVEMKRLENVKSPEQHQGEKAGETSFRCFV